MASFSMPCKVCQKIASKFCARCRSEFYCGKECQKSDWTFHKRYCQEIATFAENKALQNNILVENEEDDEYERMDKQMEKIRMEEHAKFVLANPWPEETVIMDFIKNVGNKYRHSYENLKRDGPKYYRHDLAKALYNVGSISNDLVQKQSAYRNIGWKIKDLNFKDAAGRSKIFECMSMFFYLHQHVIVGGDVLPDKSAIGPNSSPGGISGLMTAAKIIEHSWSGIGPWRA